MKNSLVIYDNEKFGKIRGLIIDGNPYFVGKDVAQALGYTNPAKALIDHVDEEDKLNNKTLSSLGQRGGWLINESGLYSLFFSSKLPAAKEFKRWVTAEVLPSIRKTGTYGVDKKYAKWLKARGNGKEIRKLETDYIKEYIETNPQGYVERFKGEMYAILSIKANRAVGLKNKGDRDNGSFFQVTMLGVIENGIRQICKMATETKLSYKVFLTKIDSWIDEIKTKMFLESYLNQKLIG